MRLISPAGTVASARACARALLEFRARQTRSISPTRVPRRRRARKPNRPAVVRQRRGRRARPGARRTPGRNDLQRNLSKPIRMSSAAIRIPRPPRPPRRRRGRARSGGDHRGGELRDPVADAAHRRAIRAALRLECGSRAGLLTSPPESDADGRRRRITSARAPFARRPGPRRSFGSVRSRGDGVAGLGAGRWSRSPAHRPVRGPTHGPFSIQDIGVLSNAESAHPPRTARPHRTTARQRRGCGASAPAPRAPGVLHENDSRAHLATRYEREGWWNHDATQPQ